MGERERVCVCERGGGVMEGVGGEGEPSLASRLNPAAARGTLYDVTEFLDLTPSLPGGRCMTSLSFST